MREHAERVMDEMNRLAAQRKELAQERDQIVRVYEMLKWELEQEAQRGKIKRRTLPTGSCMF